MVFSLAFKKLIHCNKIHPQVYIVQSSTKYIELYNYYIGQLLEFIYMNI